MVFVAIGLVPGRASAAGPVAISGSFYSQVFEIPAGGSASGPSIYVTAFNQSTEAATFILSASAPPDVTLELSDNVFLLNPAESREVMVAVHVGADAVPGLHEVTVSVRAQKDTSGGIQVLGAAEQVATLSIVGEAGSVHLESVSPRGDRVLAHVRLWKIINGSQFEVRDSHTGVIDTIVSPGRYIAKAFSMGVELDSEEFQVAHLEQKSISLTAETIYFKSFSATLARNINTGAPGYVQILYTIANVYQPVSDAAVNLEVTLNGEYLEAMPGILTLSALNTGDTGVPYQYFPGPGWETGTYGFTVQLYISGQTYASTQEATLDVEVAGATAQRSWLWILFVILGVTGAAGLGLAVFSIVRKRGQGADKPGKGRKSQEGKPAPELDPAAQPEPARASKPAAVQPAKPVPPPGPVTTAEPARAQQPPARLAAVSSLRARMASLGQDQRPELAGDEDEEAAPAETQAEQAEEPVQDSVEVAVAPAEAGPAPEPEAAAGEEPAEAEAAPLAEEPPPVAAPPVAAKPAGGRPGIVSRVTVTRSKPSKGAGKGVGSQGPAPVKPEDEIVINWPPKRPEQARAPVSPQAPPAPEQIAPQEIAAEETPVPPEEAVLAEEAASVSQAAFLDEPGGAGDLPDSEKASPSEQAAAEELDLQGETTSSPPHTKSSFLEAARLRMQARERTSISGGGEDEGERPAE